MGNNNELRILAELANHLGKLAHVGIVEGRIHLVENAERRGLNQVNGKQQRRGSKRALSPTQLVLIPGS